MQIDLASARPETQTTIVAQVVFLVKAFMPVPPEKCKLLGLVGLRSSATLKIQIGVAPVRPEKQTTIVGLPPENANCLGVTLTRRGKPNIKLPGEPFPSSVTRKTFCNLFGLQSQPQGETK